MSGRRGRRAPRAAEVPESGPAFYRFVGAEEKLVDQIVGRAIALYNTPPRVKVDALALRMNLSAAMATCPLNLEKLAGFDDFNFLHDVGGIARHLNRETGELEDYFVPRCALSAGRS